MTTATALILYGLFALGGLGLYFAMPRLNRQSATAGAVVGVAAVAGFLVLLAARVVGPVGERAYFYVFGAMAVLAAARVITHPRPVYSAIYVVALVIAVTALLILQRAEFLAVALIIIYAGAIVVTYLFVIMLAQQPGEPVYDRQSREPFTAIVVGFLLMGAIAGRSADLVDASSAATQASVLAVEGAEGVTGGNTLAVGSLLISKYVVVLEIAGILLLISMIGAIALSKKRMPDEMVRSPRRELGQAGREVEPF